MSYLFKGRGIRPMSALLLVALLALALGVAGGMAAGLNAQGGGARLMYATQATQQIYTDEGTAKLTGGKAVVKIDPLYAGMVNLKVSYQVFVTPNSADTAGLAVINETATSFEVRELQGGKGNYSFHWRIDALRLGHESERMAPAPPAPASSGPAYNLPSASSPPGAGAAQNHANDPAYANPPAAGPANGAPNNGTSTGQAPSPNRP